MKTLDELFKLYANRSFIFIRPGGNWGDMLIYMGAEYLAKKHQIKYTTYLHAELDAFKSNKEDIVYIHGAGGFNEFSSKASYNSLQKGLEAHKGIVIQGPCTVDQSAGSLAPLKQMFKQIQCEHFIFFAREQQTFKLMKEILPKSADLYIDHDTALQLTRDELIKVAQTSQQKYTLISMRQDNEANPAQANLNEQGVVLDPAYFANDFAHWIKIHVMAKKIITNRTHSSIAGAILQVPTVVFSGIYHKNQSIWAYSLQQKKVQWLDIKSLPKQTIKINKWESFYLLLPTFLQKSWKIQRLIKRLQGVPFS